MYRILKPGGVLVIIDGYLKHELKTTEEEKVMKEYCKAFVLTEPTTAAFLTNEFNKAGFIAVKEINMLKAVEPTIHYLYRLSRWLLPLAKILSILPISIADGVRR